MFCCSTNTSFTYAMIESWELPVELSKSGITGKKWILNNSKNKWTIHNNKLQKYFPWECFNFGILPT